ncbi:MAG: Crp/Fnr family transcriptional regulator [Synergistaceae bacterium]|nr:Crp/Fnr family transcriptional regulator [Synergistaceae bacterium]
MIRSAALTAILEDSFSFWNKISDLERESIMDSISDVRYEKGSCLSGSDDSCAGVFLVRSGTLRVYMLSEDGKDLTLFRLKPGEVCILSASCVLKMIRFEVLIEAETECRILVLNAKFFSDLAAGNVWVENFSYKVAAERFSDVMEAIQRIFFLSVDKRLANFLLEEMERKGCNVISLTHEQIARYIGSAREVVSRTLKSFYVLGAVELSRKGIKILDRKLLQSISK